MVILGDNVLMKNDCRIMITGNNCTVEVGDKTTFTHHCQLEAQEEGSHIIIGEDCMFSNNVLVRTNDSHYIYDAKTGTRTNPPADVTIGNHVWVAAYATVMKGSKINDGAVTTAKIASGAVTASNIDFATMPSYFAEVSSSVTIGSGSANATKVLEIDNIPVGKYLVVAQLQIRGTFSGSGFLSGNGRIYENGSQVLANYGLIPNDGVNRVSVPLSCIVNHTIAGPISLYANGVGGSSFYVDSNTNLSIVRIG